MGCPSCGRGFHSECDNCGLCHPENEAVKTLATVGMKKTNLVNNIKSNKDITDPLSTGRKRAAFLWPIPEGQQCEWQGKKNCGGGKEPIVGCREGLAVNIHHGPVKNTLRNERTNIHWICSECHNRWHAKNNPVYDEAEYDLLPHSPEEADEMELMINEAYWKARA